MAENVTEPPFVLNPPQGFFDLLFPTQELTMEAYWILPKTRVSGQTGLNMNPLGTNRPRSVDLDGSQPVVPKTDFFIFFENFPDTAESNKFEPNGLEYEP